MTKVRVISNISSLLCDYALCFALVAAAFVLGELLQDSVPGLFVFPFLAVILLSTRIWARGSSLFTTVLSTFAVAYVLPPDGSLAIDRSALPLFFSFLGCATLLSWLPSR